MAKVTNNFLKGKMNKDLDERLIQKGEYREAQNVALSESTDSDAGALEVILGNVARNIAADIDDKAASQAAINWGSASPATIGIVEDVKEKRLIYFL